MTTAENVKRALADYWRIKPEEVADDRTLDHMATIFLVSKLGVVWTGDLQKQVTVADFITTCQNHGSERDYQPKPRIKSIRDAVIHATAQHNGIRPEDVTDDTAIKLEDWRDEDRFNGTLFRLLGFNAGTKRPATVRQVVKTHEGLARAASGGI